MSRAQQAGIDNLRECGVAFRMIRDALTELSGAVPPIRERDVGPPSYTADAEEIIDGFRRALTAAASQARRETLREVYRELATLAEQPLSEELVALVGKRGEISSHDVLQLGWATAFNSVQAIMKRALATPQESA
jgi:hypothetical protein